ncbi:RsmD family RNA methyltransferase [Poriferisphaera sp. WC338]|uniref:RsmD family RNA methyltransferase n=1 Tax=Poriferisphaera sp. WC338 TaxID=3425129 RepID=UPI003D8159A8
MRIIAGIYGGRRLIGPADEKTTRPITDRVKENLFNRLWSMGLLPDDAAAALDEMDQSDLPAGPVLDIFSGTGSMGLECLSRGARWATFVDMDRDAVDRLKQNIETVDAGDRCEVLQASALGVSWIGMLREKQYAMAFVDPPYKMMAIAEDGSEPEERKRVVKMMSKLSEVVHEEGVVILRLPELCDPPLVDGWGPAKTHHYGSMAVHFYEHPGVDLDAE